MKDFFPNIMSPNVIVKHDFIIGIDPGTNTVLAIYCKKTKSLVLIKTVPIHQAFEIR
ncbi:hypothetical protein [Desertivirga xinjiangensis]|uniref:hypothetical protein n=1 Tax=Desertivirga xinjiangensis TaxID=539206 RepID=UPI00210CC33F|nr:hypothetical protein [Pedobacter xinjiangensis]